MHYWWASCSCNSDHRYNIRWKYWYSLFLLILILNLILILLLFTITEHGFVLYIHLINFLSYAHLSTLYRVLISFVDSNHVPTSISNIMSNSNWQTVQEYEMLREEWNMKASSTSNYWKTIRSRWLYTVKLNWDRTIAHLKARLVVKRCSQT